MLAATVMFSIVFGLPAAAPEAIEPGADAGEVVQVQQTEAELEEMGFMERRAAFSLNDDLHSSIEDDLLPFFLGGLCSTIGGPLWFPLLFLDDKPNEYFDEAFLSWLVWAIPLWAGAAISLIPYVGWAFGVIWCPIALGIAFYAMPVNVANAWDRAAKVHGMSDGKKKKRKKSADGDESSALPPRDEQAYALAAPSMAY